MSDAPPCGGKNGTTMIPATEEEEEQIREEYDDCLVKRCQGNSSGKKLHIPTDSGEDKLCTKKVGNGFIEKSFAVYPPGFFPLCQGCVEAWRRSKQ